MAVGREPGDETPLPFKLETRRTYGHPNSAPYWQKQCAYEDALTELD